VRFTLRFRQLLLVVFLINELLAIDSALILFDWCVHVLFDIFGYLICVYISYLMSSVYFGHIF